MKNEWIEFTKQAVPVNTKVEIKVVENNEERIYVDKLMLSMNGNYIWSYGNYDGCNVIAWRKNETRKV